MARLNYDERAILTAYKRFYGEKYPASDRTNTDAHVKAQKMCFLLSLRGISVGEFGYSWNYYGPYSAGLQSQLRALDQYAEVVRDFYSENQEDAQLFSNENKVGALFTVKQRELIDDLASSLKIVECGEDKRIWVELLGSMAFLGRSVLPGADFDMVNAELQKRKPQYDDRKRNYNAWGLLQNVGIV